MSGGPSTQPDADIDLGRLVKAVWDKKALVAGLTAGDDHVALHVDGKLDAATASRAKYWTTDVQCEVIDASLSTSFQIIGATLFVSGSVLNAGAVAASGRRP